MPTPDDLFAAESMRGPHSRRRIIKAEPFSRDWFAAAAQLRHQRYGHWLPRLLELHKHAGEVVLGLGDGLGSDWLEYARSGADLIVCPRPAALDFVRHNFELHEQKARILVGPPDALALPDASVDVVTVLGLLDDTAQPERLVAEIARLLRPGGKVIALTTARRDVDFWADACQPWTWLRKPDHFGQTRAGLRALFAPLSIQRITQRHLRRSDLPSLLRWLPPIVFERFAGRCLILKAVKPLRRPTISTAA